eukprot:Sspe_Gene.53761::Locus_29688_Transcript_1_1_Confidence_1.000_Length_1088::g.53761::m.53761
MGLSEDLASPQRTDRELTDGRSPPATPPTGNLRGVSNSSQRRSPVAHSLSPENRLVAESLSRLTSPVDDNSHKNGMIHMWRTEVGDSGHEPPPLTPQHSESCASATDRENSWVDWMEKKDKRNFLSVPPPVETGWVRCSVKYMAKYSVCQLASNRAFLMHSWPTSKWCVSQRVVVSSGPENRKEPQKVVMDITPNSCMCANVFTASCTEHHPPSTSIVIATNKSVQFSVHGEEGMQSLEHRDFHSPTAPDEAIALSTRKGAENDPVNSIFVRESSVDPVLIFYRVTSQSSTPMYSLQFRNPLTGYQAFTIFLVWLSMF